jgi:hypothetical protein
MIDKMRLDAHMANGKTEYVMCAANWIDDGIDYDFKPYNINKGRVYSGIRHPQIFELTREIYPFDKYDKLTTQGFLTTKNRFLTRDEALELVKENGQLTKPIIGCELTSEDLW